MRVVIIGAGYGGLTVALRLARADFPGEIVLVNDRPHHQLMTQMHRVAAGVVPPATVLLSLESLLRWTDVRFVQGRAIAIEPKERRVTLDGGRELTYDRLVVALGSHLETFGVPGVHEHGLTVQPVEQALRTSHHIISRLHDAVFLHGEERAAALRFVIVGGGLTGVEVAGELADRLPGEANRLGLDGRDVEIVILEAGTRLLPGLDSRTARDAADILARKRVVVRTETPVTAVQGTTVARDDKDSAGVVLADGQFLPARTVIWTAGVRAHSLVENTFAGDQRGRAFVDEYLRARDYPDVYIVGDSALAVPEGEARAAAPTAQNAVQQGTVVADSLAAEAAALDGDHQQGQSDDRAGHREVRLRPYATKPLGVFVSVGQGEAVGELAVGDFWKPRLSGVSAYAFKWAGEQRYRIAIGV